jgi:hypothetical protein
MKKKLFVVILVLFLCTGTLFADHPGGTGIGVIFGGGWGSYGLGIAGLSLKLESVPVFWGISAYLSQWGFGAGVTGDIYLIDSTLVKSGGFDLGWYFGLGALVNFHFWDGGMAIDAGARVPIGLSWHIIPQAELFLAAVPNVGLRVGPGGPLFWGVNGELGLRFWL